MKNATIQLKGRQSVKTPSVRLLSGCCQVTRLGEAQLSIVGKGSKSREVLIPAVIATRLFANRGNAPASARCAEYRASSRDRSKVKPSFQPGHDRSSCCWAGMQP